MNKRFSQLLVCLLGFVLLGLGYILLLAFSNNDKLTRFLDRIDYQSARSTSTQYYHRRNFIDAEDRTILEDLSSLSNPPAAVYLIGSSNVKYATRLWNWPEKYGSLTHNYGLGSSNHRYHNQLIHYLVNDAKGAGQPGQKALFILGLSYHFTGTIYEPDGYFPALWRRHGLFNYNLHSGLHKTSQGGVEVIAARQRVSGFVGRLLSDSSSFAIDEAGFGPLTRVQDPKNYNEDWAAQMGPFWQNKMTQDLVELRAAIQYLQSVGASIITIKLPQASWEKQAPYSQTYFQLTDKITSDLHVPVLDWSNTLPDDAFGDANHPNTQGTEILDAKLFPIAKGFLDTGALPSPSR
ncbi:MAG: hypothetical protein JWM04_1020 [Verrucomicrobiales bacterium]|nr:hypothetical protein [Verrucomicrobiales bacterium]